MSFRIDPAWSASAPASKDDRRADQRERTDPIGTADAPGGQQRARQPAGVDQRREVVAPKGKDPHPVQKL